MEAFPLKLLEWLHRVSPKTKHTVAPNSGTKVGSLRPLRYRSVYKQPKILVKKDQAQPGSLLKKQLMPVIWDPFGRLVASRRPAWAT